MTFEYDLIGGCSGTYAKLVPDEQTAQTIYEIVDMLNLENPVSPHNLHTTVIYSREECPEVAEINPPLPIYADGVRFDLFDNSDGSKCLVLVLQSELIQDLHAVCRTDYGATHDFDGYRPHITLSYDFNQQATPNNSILEYFKNLRFDRYVVEPLTF